MNASHVFRLITAGLGALATATVMANGPSTGSGFRPIPVEFLVQARGANQFEEQLSHKNNCATANAARLNDYKLPVGDIRCGDKNALGKFVHEGKYICVKCSANIAPWPGTNFRAGTVAKSPMQDDPNKNNKNQSCGNKTFGRCDKLGNCFGAKSIPSEGTTCTVPVTPKVSQPVTGTGNPTNPTQPAPPG